MGLIDMYLDLKVRNKYQLLKMDIAHIQGLADLTFFLNLNDDLRNLIYLKLN